MIIQNQCRDEHSISINTIIKITRFPSNLFKMVLGESRFFCAAVLKMRKSLGIFAEYDVHIAPYNF